ncbi:hypothetical protein NST62_01460 [Ureibacillus sp. FSL K6-8385]|uniref:hypothetical protein n=1 Tax=Ureibacillus TaxID=160795 RepID=UPI0015EE3E84|nr:hypothetical protein [Ureibacillus terrenus]MED3661337.1 hypothetical protein [Ureibacillus terrenus]MED3764191.1 hypothetical protein [Ureibacillus terrenus]
MRPIGLIAMHVHQTRGNRFGDINANSRDIAAPPAIADHAAGLKASQFLIPSC